MIAIGPEPTALATFARGLAGPPPEVTPPGPAAAIAAVISQSEPFLALFDTGSDATSFGLYPLVAAGVDAQVAIPADGVSGSSVPVIRTLTQASADACEVNPGFVAFANLWHDGTGGRPIRLAGHSKSATSMTEMLDDDLTRRLFSDEAAMVSLTTSAWGMTQRVLNVWHVTEAPAADELFDVRAPHFFGINPDGSDYDFATGDLEHCLIDTTDRGYGLFPASTKVDTMYPGNSGDAEAVDVLDPAKPNYTTSPAGVRIEGRTRQNGTPAYAMRRDFIDRSPAANRGVATVSPALVRMGDFAAGVQLSDPAETVIHPALQSKYGQILFAQDVCFAVMCGFGYAQPTRLNRTEVDSDGAFVDFVFDLPSGAALSTHRIVDSVAVGTPRPHQQQVVGFVIYRDGDTDRTARPVYRMDATTYPAAYRGTVAIHDTGSDVVGGREGVVRITPEEAFENGDKVQFGMDGAYGGFNLAGQDDYDAQLFLDGLRAYEARLDDGTTYGYPGGAVVNQEEMTVSGVDEVIPPPSGDRVVRTNADDMWLEGPSIPAATTALTFLFKGSLDVQSGTGDRNVMALTALGLVLSVETRATQRAAKARMEDSSGGVLYNSFYFDDRVPAAGVDMTLMLTATQDDGTGAWRLAIYLDGVLLETIRTGTSGTPATFEGGQTYELLRGNVGMTLERAAIWTAYSADGSEPETGLVADLQGDAAFWNGTGLPAGWSKAGTGSWVDE